ncbi:hypothetical protein B0T16DRAFT_125787 [Cercophora newfieldiana]|uniref:CFEM domain-containing protein n=1 Tax=Cercophora newfieldiana TaxID=92897 RepID=A0AA39YCP9_9PEZI|nr:hypothetical protein B0T16DRAFT_125787 [Cercophora newfieldiana]
MIFFRNVAAVGLVVAALSAVAMADSLSLPQLLDELPSCALKCFESALPGSGCNATDVECLCPSEAVRVGVAGCVGVQCTVREMLTAKGSVARLCNDPVREENSVKPVLSIFIGLAGFAVMLRILARVLTKAYFWWDDLFNGLAMLGCIASTGLVIHSVNWGLGRDIWLVDISHITELMKSFFANMLIYTATRFLIRASIILFYLRVFPPSPTNKLTGLLKWTMVFNLAYNLSFFFAVVFHCNPVPHYWNGWEGTTPGTCGNINLLAWLAAATGIAFDIWLLVLPFPSLLALNLHWKQKVMGGMMFGVGVCVMIVSFIRLKTINEFTKTDNPTMDTVGVSLWSGIELDVGVICPCLPSLRLLFRRVLPRILGTTNNYELDTTEGATDHRMTGNKTIVTARRRSREIVMPSRAKKHSHDGSNDGGSLCASVTGLVVTQDIEVKEEGRR